MPKPDDRYVQSHRDEGGIETTRYIDWGWGILLIVVPLAVVALVGGLDWALLLLVVIVVGMVIFGISRR